MKTATQASPDLAKLCKLIENMASAMLTSIADEGALVSRPMAPLEIDRHGALWFFTDLHSGKVEHLRFLNLAFTDPSRGTYVSLSGHGEIAADRGRIDRLWTTFARPWFPAGPDSPNLALLRFVPEAAEYWDAPHSKMVRLFTMAASVSIGKPVGLGEHETMTALSAS